MTAAPATGAGGLVTAPELEGVETFRIVGFDFDPSANTAFFDYAFDDTHLFRETVEFGGVPLGPQAAAGIERALRLVHLAAGVSYFKAAAPQRIVVETGPLSHAEAALLHDLYDKGMREFAMANDLHVPLQFELTSGPDARGPGDGAERGMPGDGSPRLSRAGAPAPGIAVPIGGGKDSIVLVEALRSANPPRELQTWLVAINQTPAMQRTAAVAGLPCASIKRTVSPRLLELNAAGALNGHVPITAIVSLVSVAAGYVYGWDTTLMALERSADEATALVDDVAVNHQWSKSTECELGLRSVVRESVADSIEYCSGLRSCGELEIARWFADLPSYHAAFRSCNRSYRPGGRFDAWCGECPKCRFVFLVLAPFLEPVPPGGDLRRQPAGGPFPGRGVLGPVRRRAQALRVRRRAARVVVGVPAPAREPALARLCGAEGVATRDRGRPPPRRRRSRRRRARPRERHSDPRARHPAPLPGGRARPPDDMSSRARPAAHCRPTLWRPVRIKMPTEWSDLHRARPIA